MTVSLHLRTSLTRFVGVASVGALALAGCSGVSVHGASGDATSTMSGGSSSTTPVASSTPAEIVVSPADRAADVLPDAALTVAAKVGTITSVTVTDAKGAMVKGAIGADGTWAASSRLKPAAFYTVDVEAAGPAGAVTKERTTFATLRPKTIATYGINYSGMTVGVGMPVAIQFDSQVTTKAYRAAVEKAVTITTVPKQAGSWGWLDNRQLMWRPKSYWIPGTKVTVNAPLTGLQTGDSKWVSSDETGGFTVGAATISTVNIAAHEMTVTQNGKVLRTIPVSTGKASSATRSGVKVIIEKQPTVIMDSATVGIPKGNPDYYYEKVDWDLRVTWTGEYLHSAPWSVNSQGAVNVSHGCTNLSPANAQWMYNLSKVGDVVNFVGSTRVFQPTEGIGVWQYSFAQWQQQSALA